MSEQWKIGYLSAGGFAVVEGDRLIARCGSQKEAEYIRDDHNAALLARPPETPGDEVERLRKALEEIAKPGCASAFASALGHDINTCRDMLRVIREHGAHFGAPHLAPVEFRMEHACTACRAALALARRPQLARQRRQGHEALPVLRGAATAKAQAVVLGVVSPAVAA